MAKKNGKNVAFIRSMTGILVSKEKEGSSINRNQIKTSNPSSIDTQVTQLNNLKGSLYVIVIALTWVSEREKKVYIYFKLNEK